MASLPQTQPGGLGQAPAHPARRDTLLGSSSIHTKNHIVAVISEFVGTFLFLFFAYGGTNVVNSAPSYPQSEGAGATAAKMLYISLIFGLSLAVNVWAFFRVGGGLFNPAVAVGMWLTGANTFLRTILVIIAQVVAAIAAAGLVAGLLPGPLVVGTRLGNGMSVVRGLFLEMFLTAELVFVIFMLASEKHRATFIAPVGIGLALFIIEMMGVYYTGGSVNPARSFGPDVVTGFPGYHWIYWLGPALGAAIASGFYKFLQAMDYGTVSPGVDDFPNSGPSSVVATNMTNRVVGPGTEKPALSRSDRTDQFAGERTSSTAANYNRGPSLDAGRGVV